jgi:hypothetical protein
MSRSRQAFLWMIGLSLVTLVLGVLREFAIARELRASGDADLFFRGLVVIGTGRMFGMALFRSRWIPVPAVVPARSLMRAERRTCAGLAVVGLLVLAVFIGPVLVEPTGWLLAGSVVLAVYGSAVRALAERAGHERRGFVLEWALPIGAIAGALLLPRSTLGPALGIFVGLLVGLVALLPILARGTGPEGQVEAAAAEDPRRTRVLLLDALIYGNLALTDTAFSPLYAEGQFALLNYGYLFVNAAMMAPLAAATVVGLRLATGGDPAVHAVLRRWAVIGGLVSAAIVAAVGGLLAWGPVAAQVDARVGWALSAEAGTFVLWSVPFAGLRMANNIGRQFVVATEPRRVLGWDIGGLALRALILGACATTLGIFASPVAIAFAELVQLAAWWRRPAVVGAETRPV